jgi:hypothetical protein
VERVVRSSVAIVLSAICSSGCYQYTPTDLTATPPGQQIRVQVTREGAAEMAEVFPIDARFSELTGTLTGVEGGDALIQIPVAQRQEGFHTVNLKQTIRVPILHVFTAEVKRLDRIATGFLIGGTAATGVGIVLGIVKAFSSTGGTEDPPDSVDRRRLRIFKIPIGR